MDDDKKIEKSDIQRNFKKVLRVTAKYLGLKLEEEELVPS